MPRHRSVVEIAAMLMQFRNEFLVAARRLLPARFAHRFARAEEAAAAVEFALVAAPFLALLPMADLSVAAQQQLGQSQQWRPAVGGDVGLPQRTLLSANQSNGGERC